jgi:hypothetical protein
MLDLEEGLSSNNMREECAKSSSNWPDLTPHRKAKRNKPATEILAISRIRMTLIIVYIIAVKVFFDGWVKGNECQAAH